MTTEPEFTSPESDLVDADVAVAGPVDPEPVLAELAGEAELPVETKQWYMIHYYS